ATAVHQLARSGSQWVALVSGSTGTRVLLIENAALIRQVAIEEFTPYHGRSFGAARDRLISYGQDAMFAVNAANGRIDRIDVAGLGEGIGQVKSIAADERLDWVAIGGNGSGGTDNAAQVISVATRRVVSRLAGHTGEVYA